MLEKVVLLNPKFIQILDFTVKLKGMGEKLLFLVKIWFLYFSELLRFFKSGVEGAFRLEFRDTSVFFWKEDSGRIVTSVNDST